MSMISLKESDSALSHEGAYKNIDSILDCADRKFTECKFGKAHDHYRSVLNIDTMNGRALRGMKSVYQIQSKVLLQKRNVQIVTINLMWINSKRKDDDFLYPEDQKRIVESSLRNWADKNPQTTTQIHFWYDSAYISDKALQNTEAYLSEALGQEIFKRIIFRDIRALPLVEKNANVFSEDVPIYYRADLVRFIAAEHDLKSKSCDHFVYSDLKVTPEAQQYLFNPQTGYYLDQFGFAMLRNDLGEGAHMHGGHLGFENGFMVCSNNEHFLKAVNHIIINPGLLVRDYIDTNIRDNEDLKKTLLKGLEQTIYDTIQGMFAFLLCLKNNIPIVFGADLDKSKNLITYNRSIRAVSIYPFDLLSTNYFDIEFRSLFDRKAMYMSFNSQNYHKLEQTEPDKYWPAMPVIRLRSPKSHFC